jgi:hypothetical protein
MTVKELLDSARFLVDEAGNKKSVLIDYELWEYLLELLEDWEDSEEIQRLRESDQEWIPWEQVKAELFAEEEDV